MFSFTEDCQEVTNLLIRSISGSVEIFSTDQSLEEHVTSLSNQLFRDTNPERYKTLIQIQFDEIIVYTMEMSKRKGNFKLLSSVLELIIIITNNSEEFVYELLKTSLPQLLINNTIIIVRILNRKQINLYFLNLYLTIIFNIVRFYQCRENFQENDKIVPFKSALTPLLSASLTRMKIYSLLILAFLNKEADKYQKIILHNLGILDDICKYISNASKSIGKQFKGFNIWELLIGLDALSRIEPIKLKMLKTKGLINTIIEVVSSTDGMQIEISVALEILYNLSENEKQQKISLSRDQVYVIESLARNSVDSIKKNAERLLVNLSRFKNNKECDIFISHSIHDKDFVDQLTDKLKTNYKICNRPGHYYDGFSKLEADIDCSRTVIIIISDLYHDNYEYQAEALCAYQKKKPIIVILLIKKNTLCPLLSRITKSNKNIDFTNDSEILESMDKLFRALQRNFSQGKRWFNVFRYGPVAPPNLYNINRGQMSGELESSNKDKPRMPTENINKDDIKNDLSEIQPVVSKNQSNTEILLSDELESKCFNTEFNAVFWLKRKILNTKKSEKNCIGEWDHDKIVEWTTSNKLSELQSRLVDVSMLEEIIRLRNTTPKIYYEHLKTTLELPFFEILRLDIAIDKLSD